MDTKPVEILKIWEKIANFKKTEKQFAQNILENRGEIPTIWPLINCFKIFQSFAIFKIPLKYEFAWIYDYRI